MPQFSGKADDTLVHLSAAQLAFLGDAVYSLLVRGSLVQQPMGLRKMHLQTTARVNAPAQARCLGLLLPHLTDVELEYVKQGRNAHHNSIPKAASHAQYGAATGLETLFGYLYISGQEERLEELFGISQAAHTVSSEGVP